MGQIIYNSTLLSSYDTKIRDEMMIRKWDKCFFETIVTILRNKDTHQ